MQICKQAVQNGFTEEAEKEKGRYSIAIVDSLSMTIQYHQYGLPVEVPEEALVAN